MVPVLLALLLYALMPETLQRRAGDGRDRQGAWTTLFGGGRAPATLLLWIAFLPTLLILYLILNWLPTLAAGKGMTRAVAPLASLAFNLASVAGALLVGRLVDRFDLRWPLTVAYAGLAVALFGLSRSGTMAEILVLSGAAGFFVLGANFALYGLAPTYYSPETRGTGSGASIAVGARGIDHRPVARGHPARRRHLGVGRRRVLDSDGHDRRRWRVRAELLSPALLERWQTLIRRPFELRGCSDDLDSHPLRRGRFPTWRSS